VQNALTFLIYSRMAAEALGRADLIGKVLMPFFSAFVVYLTVILCVAVGSADIKCDHPAWLLVSVSIVAIALGFLLVGCRVMREIDKAASVQVGAAARPAPRAAPRVRPLLTRPGLARAQVQHSELMGGEQGYLEEKRHQLYTLMIVRAPPCAACRGPPVVVGAGSGR